MNEICQLKFDDVFPLDKSCADSLFLFLSFFSVLALVIMFVLEGKDNYGDVLCVLLRD